VPLQARPRPSFPVVSPLHLSGPKASLIGQREKARATVSSAVFRQNIADEYFSPVSDYHTPADDGGPGGKSSSSLT
jgi:hypothetical protein